ncbi:L-tyrosine/L-tryptophan isonitrile synthase family protein [Pseudomonas sp. CCM 7893]|uniref:L-tyrosine/L-tryptophan isonitrile synthase family protein n=1 Tax=Pseudomonas spelaei TaxID=1055469 RepID=A0A6I3WMF9_9PSED|nr:isocyanide synthase family protein [Pseudomonas spelaei]MUF08382.1 L-tyrosine/L-tryptophan isonitrile synthase family protein [Pseudomonas spelaei]
MSKDTNHDISLSILKEILKIRRENSEHTPHLDAQEKLEQIKAIQLPRILSFVNANQPIEFILPAFPAKSPSPKKVLGCLPDMAEKISLTFLNELCTRITRLYKPGAKLIICSDGRVFGDLIRASDDRISAYQVGIRRIISGLTTNHLSLFSLEDFIPFAKHASSFDSIRLHLIDQFAEPIEEVKQKLLTEEGGTLLYRAVTRFMLEDGLIPSDNRSRSILQKDAKKRALGVIQVSRAWAALLDNQFPDAIRLSIHPQPVNSLKIGVHMIPTVDSWLTPWHGVAVKIGGKFELMKRSVAESLGGRIVILDQQQSHYEIDLP